MTADLSVKVAGADVPVTFTDSLSDIAEWCSGRGLLGLDTETAGGIDIYSDAFDVRLLQLADVDEAIVVPVEEFDTRDRRLLGDIIREHARYRGLAIHNADFDLAALDRVGILSLDAIGPHDIRDTRSISYLLDSRPAGVGNALGHSLKALADAWIDPQCSELGQAILDARFRELGYESKADGFTNIPLRDHDYVIYAALDAVLTRRLVDIFQPFIEEQNLQRLERFDNEVSDACRKMRRHGLDVDADYIESSLIPYLEQREAEARRDALFHGVTNIFSSRECVRVLMAQGWQPTEETPSGQPKLDKTILADLVADGNDLARAILQGKQAAKYLATYAVPLLEERDSNNRVHAEIRPTGAITGRMSISRPPLQQLPSTGPDAYRIRQAIVAGEGQVFGSCDYSQVEFRIMGALAQESTLIEAVTAGEDVYDTIARSIYGEGFTGADRKVAKMIALARIFGSGNSTIARQAGLTIHEANDVVRKYDQRFPRMRSFSRRLQDRASLGRREVITPSGRRIRQEADALYRATNHLVQSTASDLLKQALLDLIYEGGLVPGPDIRLCIHDEILFASPSERFDDRALTVSSFMTTTFLGMPIASEASLVGPSWGDAYKP